MTSKGKTIIAAWIAGISQFIGWFATLDPSAQGQYVQPFIDLLPVAWRTTIGGVMKAIAGASLIYALFQAAHSGPQTPPKNPPSQ